MSTHRRAWKQRAGVVVALVVGALLAVPATPASAARISTADNSVTIEAGKSSSVNVVVRPDIGETSADIDITDLPDGVTCGGCGPISFETPGPKQVTLTLSAAGNAPAANGAQAKITVTGDNSPRTLRVTVKPSAPPEAQTVKSISGKVIIADNSEPLEGVVVMLRDSKGITRQTNTDGSGNFRFTGSSSDPIAPGRVDLASGKDGKTGYKTINATAGQAVTGVRISVPIKVEKSPSPSPSASAEPVPTDEATDEATDTPATEAAAGQQPAAQQDSGGFGNWLLILLGGLFVAVGVGTIVLLYMKRKNEGDDDVDGDGPGGPMGPGGPAGAGAVPAARGAYRGADDQTRVVSGMGAGAAPTMVGGPSLSDAPTMMHRPVVDDVPPDPYGAPPGPAYGVGGGQDGWGGGGYGDEPAGQGGYGHNGYGNAPSSGGGYGNAPSSGGGYGNAPSSGGGYGSRDYGAGAAGYPPAQGGGYGGERYDEPTGRYTGDNTQYAPPADPYPTSTYQPDQGRGYDQPDPGRGYDQPDQGRGYDRPDQGRGYDQPGQGQYGRGPEPGTGYGQGGGYGGPSGGYDNGPSGGYDGGQQGYDGYDQRGGYDNGPQQGYDGHDQRGGYRGDAGYGQPQQGGYGHEQPPQQRTGGYDNQGYDQGGHYGDPAQAGRGRPDGPQERGGRRLDWLDD
ncbi:carboxypeptidase regulatory-like domain-containing protein [Micromonospora sp. NPDC007230]|uniref:carboxypeptidase regulatory-like domain-containing protein n=1 Tax=Micromonospora sp. NPDC007230 TaxID=3364237 RepID=UPI0036874811